MTPKAGGKTANLRIKFLLKKEQWTLFCEQNGSV